MPDEIIFRKLHDCNLDLLHVGQEQRVGISKSKWYNDQSEVAIADNI